MRHTGLSLKHVGLIALLGLGLTACFVLENTYSVIPPGPWRGILKLDQNPVTPNPRGEPLPEKVGLQFEEVTEGQLPFNFEVTYVNADSLILTLQNATEQIVVQDMVYGRNRATGDDTIRFFFPQSDGTYIRAMYAGGVIEGEWIPRAGAEMGIPFVAYHGKSHRFTELRKPPIQDLSGRWSLTAGLDTDSTYFGTLILTQQGNDLTGVWESEAVQCAHLQGTIQEDKAYLSYFNGQEALLIEAKVTETETLIGSLRNGDQYRTIWEAQRNGRTPAQ